MNAGLKKGRVPKVEESTADFVSDAIQRRIQLSTARMAHRGLPFKLTFKEYREMCFADCHYCGLSADKGALHTYSGRRYRSHGVDRMDNLLGYEHGNVVTACTYCNYAKSDSHVLDWLKHISVIAERMRGFPGLENHDASLAASKLCEAKRVKEVLRELYVANLRENKYQRY